MARVDAHDARMRLNLTVAGVAVLAGLVLAALADRVSVPEVTALPAGAFGVQGAPAWEVVSARRLPREGELRERLELFDPTPLFLPETGGAAGAGSAEAGGAEGGALEDYPAALRFGDTAPMRAMDEARPALTPQTTATTLAAPRWFDGMARADQPVIGAAAVVRAARAEIYRAGESGKLAAVDLLRANGLDGVVWRPMELSVWVADTGLVAAPVVVTSSGVDAVDERIRWIVARELLPTLLLRPGMYRLEVGP